MAITEKWEYELLDLQDRPLRLLDGVEPGGKLTLNSNADIRGSGSITWHSPENLDWMRHRIKIWFTSDGHRWPMGVYTVAAPDTNYSDGDRVQPLTLLDKTSIQAEDAQPKIYSVPKGAGIISRATSLIPSSGGGTRIAATPSSATVGTLRTWEIDDTTLRIINDLLESIGYWALWTDREGQYRLEPYTLPAARPVSRRYLRGDSSWHLADILQSTTDFTTPNRVVVSGESRTDANHNPLPPLTAMAENRDPDSRFSYQHRGRWITKTYTNVEADSQAVLKSLAKRYLNDLSTSNETITLKHRHLPQWLNDVIEVRDQVSGLYTVETMDFTMTPGTLVTTKARKVVNL